MFADLHLHTSFSDGTFSPEELVAQGKSHGLAALALTDHDTVEGCARTEAACRVAGIEFVPGVELTAESNGTEVHLLGYFFRTDDRDLLAEIGQAQAVRQDRIREMVERLNRIDVPLRLEDVLALANCRSPGRPHVARALVEAGLCPSLDVAFEKYLKFNRPAWVPKAKISVRKAIDLVQGAGGVAVLAHPGLNRNDDIVLELAVAGLDGLECFHTKHSNTAARRYAAMAEELHLLVTGGSDCHGLNKGRPLIGSVKLPYECVEKLRERAAQRGGATGTLTNHATAERLAAG